MHAKLLRLIRRHGLSKYRDMILASSGYGLRLTTRPPRAKPLALGVTKLGGNPHVPRDFRWPTRGKLPLTFIGQVNVAHAQEYAHWPSSGLLLFFYDVAKQPWGFSPKDADSSAIIHVPIKGLRAMPSPAKNAPINEGGPLKECAVTQTKVFTIPPDGNPALQTVLPTTKAQLAYMHMSGEFNGEGTRPHHQFGGWPQIIQNDMEAECELAYNGIDCGGLDKEANSKRAQLLSSGASHWQLLLQVGSDDNLGVTWDDCGRIYFYATARARANLDFTERWTILQCY